MKCKLCLALENEKDKYLFEDDECVILPTKNMKGHNKRIMIVSKDHYVTDNSFISKILLTRFIAFCKEYFDEEPTFALCQSTYATIPDHWHRIACDWKGNEDIEQLHYTPHVALKTKVRWRPNGYKDKR